MGVGTLLFSMEARVQREIGTSLPLGKPKRPMEPFTEIGKIHLVGVAGGVFCGVGEYMG
jgi:hypothetical protein